MFPAKELIQSIYRAKSNGPIRTVLDCFVLYWSKTLTHREMLSCISPWHLPKGNCSLVLAPDTYSQGNALLYKPPTLTNKEMLSCICLQHLPTGEFSLLLAPTLTQREMLSFIGHRYLPTGICSLVLAPDTYPQRDALSYWPGSIDSFQHGPWSTVFYPRSIHTDPGLGYIDGFVPIENEALALVH